MAMEEKIPFRFKLGLSVEVHAPLFCAAVASEKKSAELLAAASRDAQGVVVGLVSVEQSEVLFDAP